MEANNVRLQATRIMDKQLNALIHHERQLCLNQWLPQPANHAMAVDVGGRAPQDACAVISVIGPTISRRRNVMTDPAG